jgi:hypothetical protein
MGSRKKKQERDKKKRAQARKRRAAQRDFLEGATILEMPPGERKMSEVLLEFIEPYTDQCPTEDALGKLVTVGVVAWNAALESGSKRQEFIDHMVEAVPPEARPAMRGIIAELIQRKLAYFAGNRRAIVDYQLSMTPQGPHLSVVSTMDLA